MTNKRPSASLSSSPQRRKRVGAFCALALFALVASSACRFGGDESDTKGGGGVVVVNAPAAGEVRRVFVSEGVSIAEGEAVIEIVVRTEVRGVPQAQGEDPQAVARRNIGAAQSEIEAARAEVVRTEVEMQRLTPLVASGEAPQGQLDGARADYDRAQQRLQRATSAAQGAQSGLVAARQQQTRNSAPPVTTATTEQVVLARASTGGVVSAVSARPGDRVKAGQPLATLRTRDLK